MAFVALFTVAVISVVANIFINRQFGEYVAERQKKRTESILSDLERQYDEADETWDVEFLHTIGMSALFDGYIIKIYDTSGGTLWDAEKHNMSACARIVGEITQRMRARFPDSKGEFTTNGYDLERNGRPIAGVSISYFSPYFYDDDDFRFLDSLNVILAGSGVFSLLLAVTAGWLLSRRLSDPIRKTAAVAKRMSEGDYVVRIEEKTNIDELRELTASVNQLADSLCKQENLRKRMTADVAHELRTPLGNIAAHIEAMTEGVWEPTPERLSSCHEEIKRISRLVFDLENLARVESENLKLDKTRFALAELAEKTVSAFEADIAAKKLDVSVEGDRSDISADRGRIQQILINLLSNAVKYTPENGAIRVRVSEATGAVFLDVEDNGAGIPRDELPFVFERFYRADKSRNRLSGGAGIGLAVVKSIAAAHGGRAEAESREGNGSRFRITLPK
ncbi:MAG: HAMP domain-containing protein [Synergistaceae bacterium]|nr:HAMP domain-containing protein [Synergistaceae bacterium]